MNREMNLSGGKKPYEPPQLMTISLRPEEAVLGHCKTSSSNDQCGNPCISFLCRSVGS
jgi:hypothetical protein